MYYISYYNNKVLNLTTESIDSLLPYVTTSIESIATKLRGSTYTIIAGLVMEARHSIIVNKLDTLLKMTETEFLETAKDYSVDAILVNKIVSQEAEEMSYTIKELFIKTSLENSVHLDITEDNFDTYFTKVEIPIDTIESLRSQILATQMLIIENELNL